MKAIIVTCLLASIPFQFFAQNKNRLSVESSPIHYFFDQNPIINTRYNSPGDHYIYLGGFGINLTRELSTKQRISIEVSSLTQTFRKYSFVPIDNPVTVYRAWTTFKVNYTKVFQKEKTSYLIGGGLNYINGIEGVGVSSALLSQYGSNEYFISLEKGKRNDLGLNIFAGIEYNIKEYFFLYSKIDFLSVLYIDDKEYKNTLRNTYNSPQFPSRFDLSLSFGVGVRF